MARAFTGDKTPKLGRNPPSGAVSRANFDFCTTCWETAGYLPRISCVNTRMKPLLLVTFKLSRAKVIGWCSRPAQHCPRTRKAALARPAGMVASTHGHLHLRHIGFEALANPSGRSPPGCRPRGQRHARARRSRERARRLPHRSIHVAAFLRRVCDQRKMAPIPRTVPDLARPVHGPGPQPRYAHRHPCARQLGAKDLNAAQAAPLVGRRSRRIVHGADR